jgi:hypothetical protein
MRFIKEWNDYLKESVDFNTKKSEIDKKREEIQTKISQIEIELDFINQDKVEVTTENAGEEVVDNSQVQELELKLESLKNELNNLDAI